MLTRFVLSCFLIGVLIGVFRIPPVAAAVFTILGQVFVAMLLDRKYNLK